MDTKDFPFAVITGREELILFLQREPYAKDIAITLRGNKDALSVYFKTCEAKDQFISTVCRR